MKKAIFVFGIICLAILLPSLSSSASEEDFNMAQSYYIYPGDVLEINVYGGDYMHNPPFKLRVSGDGTVYFPLLGRVELAGLTEVEAIEKLDRALRDQEYLKAPQVTLVVVEKAWLVSQRQFSISGAVKKPGKYPITGAVTLLDAINIAGGLKGESDTSKVVVQRAEKRIKKGAKKIYVVDLDKNGNNFEVMVRDRIIVDSRGTYFINGQIESPGRYYLSKDLTVAQAIIEAGGFTDIAAKNSIKVIRDAEGGKTEVLRVPVASILGKGKKSKDVILKDGDIIEVPESWF